MRRLSASLVLAMAVLAAPIPAAFAETAEKSQLTSLPPPEGYNGDEGDLVYRIGPFDKLKISVFGVPELTDKEIQADATGRISFPLAGILDVRGLSPAGVEELLRDRLSARYFEHPEVTVNVSEVVSNTVTVDGEVKTPGLYPVMGRITLLRAIAKAGGMAEFAKPRNVIVLREVHGQRLAGVFDVERIRMGVYADPLLYPDDVVVVGRSRSRVIFKDVLSTVPLIAPVIYLLRN